MRKVIALASCLALASIAPAFAAGANGSNTGSGTGGNGGTSLGQLGLGINGLGVAGGYGNHSFNTKTITQLATGHGVIAGGNVKQTTKFQSNTLGVVGATGDLSPTFITDTNSN